jgi:hypothetical protein
MSRITFALLAFSAALVVGGAASAKGKASRSRCRYGGLSDSRGRHVRCLTRAEAQQLEDESAAPEPESGDDTPRKSLPVVEVRATFERGKTGVAKQRLSANAAVFARCVADHGGLTKERGEVRIRFQVAKSGRAREVSVSKRRFVAPSAARCIAESIDGTFLGVPSEQPTVGTAVLRLR